MERASHDLRSVITTYEGKHNHDVPAARGSGSYAMTRPPVPTNNPVPTAIRPSVISNGTNFANRMQSMQNQTPYTLQMLQGTDNFAFSGFGNSYLGQMQQTDNGMSLAKEEPKDSDQFFDSFLN